MKFTVAESQRKHHLFGKGTVPSAVAEAQTELTETGFRVDATHLLLRVKFTWRS